jgi:hypothetical protein
MKNSKIAESLWYNLRPTIVTIPKYLLNLFGIILGLQLLMGPQVQTRIILHNIYNDQMEDKIDLYIQYANKLTGKYIYDIPPHHAPRQCLPQHHLASRWNGKTQRYKVFCPYQVPE